MRPVPGALAEVESEAAGGAEIASAADRDAEIAQRVRDAIDVAGQSSPTGAYAAMRPVPDALAEVESDALRESLIRRVRWSQQSGIVADVIRRLVRKRRTPSLPLMLEMLMWHWHPVRSALGRAVFPWQDLPAEIACALCRAWARRQRGTLDHIARLAHPQLWTHAVVCGCVPPGPVRRSTLLVVLNATNTWRPELRELVGRIMAHGVEDDGGRTSLMFHALSRCAPRASFPAQCLGELGERARPDELLPLLSHAACFPAYCGVRHHRATLVHVGAILRKLSSYRRPGRDTVRVDWAFPGPRLDVELLLRGESVRRCAQLYRIEGVYERAQALCDSWLAPRLPLRPRIAVVECLVGARELA